MASITFAVDDELKTRISEFPWVNWSEIARENLLKKARLEELRNELESDKEKELASWSILLGKKINTSVFKELVSKLSSDEKRKLGI